MADQSVRINIGSTFNGAGVNKALGAVNGLSNQAKRAAGAVGQLAGAFDSLGAGASKEIGAITGALGALASGGIIGAVTVGFSSLVSYAQKLGEQYDPVKKTKDAIDRLNESQKQFDSRLSQDISRIDAYAASVENLNKATLRLVQAEGRQKSLQIQNQIDDVPNGGTDEDVSNQMTTRAELRRQKVYVETENDLAAANAAWQSASDHVATLEMKLTPVTLAFNDMEDKLKGFEKAIEDAEIAMYARAERGASPYDRGVAARNYLDAVEARDRFYNTSYTGLKRRKEGLESEVEAAQNLEKAANVELENVIAQNARKRDQAEKAYHLAITEAEAVLERQTRADEQLIAEQNAYAANIQARDERQNELDAATRELAVAERDYAKKLKQASDARAAMEAVGNGGVWNPNGATAGRDRSSGPASNNSDNSGSAFSQARGKSARYWQTHRREAEEKGIVVGMSDKEQSNFDAMTRKLQNAGALTAEEREKVLGKKGAKEWEEAYKKTPEYQAELQKIRADKSKDKVDNLKTKVEQLKTSVDNINTWLERHGGAH